MSPCDSYKSVTSLSLLLSTGKYLWNLLFSYGDVDDNDILSLYDAASASVSADDDDDNDDDDKEEGFVLLPYVDVELFAKRRSNEFSVSKCAEDVTALSDRKDICCCR